MCQDPACSWVGLARDLMSDAYTYVYVCIYIYIYYTYIYTHTYIHIYIYNTCVYKYIYIYIYISPNIQATPQDIWPEGNICDIRASPMR